jgi:hypothetical protein
VDLVEDNNWVRALFGPDEPRPIDGLFVLHNVMPGHGSPVLLLTLQITPRLRLLKILWVQEKEPKCVCMSKAEALQSHRMWTEVSSSAPHLKRTICHPH